jgi:hypothetical protein
MSYFIEFVDPDRPVDLPSDLLRPTYLRLVCDGDHGLLKPPEIRIDGQFDEREAAARALGWRWRVGDTCIVLCPECAQ